MDILFSPAFAPFTAAFIGVLILGILELVSLLITGGGTSDLVQVFADTDGFESSALWTWLLVRGLPLSVVLVLLFTFFGATGFALQSLAPAPFNAALVSIVSVVVAVLGTRVAGRALAPVFAGKTDAVSESTFIGKTVLLQSPVCRAGMLGEAKVSDAYGNQHTVMVEPENAEDSFVLGDTLRLTKATGPAHFSVVKA